MSLDWVTPAATAMVGIAGIAGTIYGARLQRGTQLQSVTQQRSLEAAAEAKLQKQTAFAEFWNAYQTLLRELHVRGQGHVPGARPSRDRDRVADAFAHLFMKRNVVALLASLYTTYYMDQIMGDAEAMIEVPEETVFEPKFPNAGHYVYYLMRAELSSENLDGQDADDVVNALRVNSLRQASIARVLRKSNIRQAD